MSLTTLFIHAEVPKEERNVPLVIIEKVSLRDYVKTERCCCCQNIWWWMCEAFDRSATAGWRGFLRTFSENLEERGWSDSECEPVMFTRGPALSVTGLPEFGNQPLDALAEFWPIVSGGNLKLTGDDETGFPPHFNFHSFCRMSVCTHSWDRDK